MFSTDPFSTKTTRNYILLLFFDSSTLLASINFCIHMPGHLLPAPGLDLLVPAPLARSLRINSEASSASFPSGFLYCAHCPSYYYGYTHDELTGSKLPSSISVLNSWSIIVAKYSCTSILLTGHNKQQDIKRSHPRISSYHD